MAKTQSLLEISSGKALTLPDTGVFGPMVVTQERFLGPYVMFAQPKATDQWTSLAQKLPGIQDGDQVLVFPEPEAPVKLSPMRFTMISCTQFWVQRDAAGNPIGKPSLEAKPRADKWGEEVFAACIAYVPRGGTTEAVPCTCMFKTVKCGAAITLKQQIEAASKVEWADHSDAHRAAFAAFAHPYLRVVAAVTTSKRTSGGGFSYVQARSIVSPATPTEYGAIDRLMKEGDGLRKLKELATHYHGRLKEIGVA